MNRRNWNICLFKSQTDFLMCTLSFACQQQMLLILRGWIRIVAQHNWRPAVVPTKSLVAILKSVNIMPITYRISRTWIWYKHHQFRLRRVIPPPILDAAVWVCAELNGEPRIKSPLRTGMALLSFSNFWRTFADPMKFTIRRDFYRAPKSRTLKGICWLVKTHKHKSRG